MSSGLEATEVAPDVFDDGSAGVLVRVVPQGESNTLEMSWVVPPEYKQYRQTASHSIPALPSPVCSPFACFICLVCLLFAGPPSNSFPHPHFPLRGLCRPPAVPPIVDDPSRLQTLSLPLRLPPPWPRGPGECLPAAQGMHPSRRCPRGEGFWLTGLPGAGTAVGHWTFSGGERPVHQQPLPVWRQGALPRRSQRPFLQPRPRCLATAIRCRRIPSALLVDVPLLPRQP